MADLEINDPVLGRLGGNKRFGYYEGSFPFGDGSVSFSLHADDAGDVSTTLNRARQFFANFARVSRGSEDYLVTELLAVKNDGWLDEGEEPLTPEEFRARLELAGIEFVPEGYVQIFYDCDERFTDHCLSVTMDESGEFVSAGVEG
jgi:hypothetical protein